MCAVKVLNLQRTCFRRALVVQEKIRQKIVHQLETKCSRLANTLILVEHPAVYTCGIRSKEYTAEVADKLRSIGAEFVYTDRGGLITFHGVGQLVAYPIVYLGSYSKNSVRCYVRQLENTVIRLTKVLLRKNNVKVSTIKEYPGVWIEEERKIAALGIHVKRHVTTHGVAVNCNTDLAFFDHIIPCGIPGKRVTSLSKELNREITVEEVIPHFINAFRETFGCELEFV